MGIKQRRQRVRKMNSFKTVAGFEKFADKLAQKERIDKHGGLEGYIAYLERVCAENGVKA